MNERQFTDTDLAGLFDNESSYGRNYRFGPITEELIKRAEKKMEYRIPDSYRELLEYQNGGVISEKLDESWLSAIYGISEDPENFYGLENMFENWKEEWEYPDIGIPFGETASAGHDMYYMDFRVTDENGEPRIVRIDNEMGNEIYLVAENLPEFIRMILANEKPDEKLIDKGEKIEYTPVKPKTAVLNRKPLIIALTVIDVLLLLLLLITFSIPAARIILMILIGILTACILCFPRSGK